MEDRWGNLDKGCRHYPQLPVKSNVYFFKIFCLTGGECRRAKVELGKLVVRGRGVGEATRGRSGEKCLGLGYVKRELTRFAKGWGMWGAQTARMTSRHPVDTRQCLEGE